MDCIHNKLHRTFIFRKGEFSRFCVLICLFFCCSLSAKDPAEKTPTVNNQKYAAIITDIIEYCNQNGFSSASCNSRFYGKYRTVFHVKILEEEVELAEKNFEKFLHVHYSVLGFSMTFSWMRIEFSSTLDVNLNPETLAKFHFKEVQSNYIEIRQEPDDEQLFMALVFEDNIWKMAIAEKFEKQFWESRLARHYALLKIRRNIFNYQVFRAQLTDVAKSDLIDAVNTASLPILMDTAPDELDGFESLQKLTLEEVYADYYALDTKVDFINKLRQQDPDNKELETVEQFLIAMDNQAKGEYEKAFPFLQEAAKQGHIEAQYELGLAYDEGYGIAVDDAMAVKWYRRAADQNFAPAQTYLAYMYSEGEGIPQSYKKAKRWAEKAAEQGSPGAINFLGTLYMDGLGVEQDYGKSIELFRKSAASGDVEAQYNLGVLYTQGFGVEIDYLEAMSWFEKAAEQGDMNAHFNIALIYVQGKGVPQDIEKGIELMRNSAQLGKPKAQYFLGEAYYNGTGTEQDLEKAVFWLNEALKRGFEPAQDLLNEISTE